jgi:phage shock protein E
VDPIDAAELAGRIDSGTAPLVLDVRTADEFQRGSIPGALNIPHDTLAERLDELPVSRSEEIVVHCQSGKRAALAEAVLIEAGYSRVRELDGHWQGWQDSGLAGEVD